MFRLRKSIAAIGRFGRNRRGSAAIEFAFIAPIFFALVFAILETALVFFAQQVLETAAQDSARMIMTGQAQSSSFSKAQFKTNVCSHIPALLDCANGVYVDVQSFPSFSTLAIADPIDPGTKQFVDNTQYSPGASGDIVVVRLFYQWQLYVTGLGYNITNLAGNKRLLSATAAFRNEPF